MVEGQNMRTRRRIVFIVRSPLAPIVVTVDQASCVVVFGDDAGTFKYSIATLWSLTVYCFTTSANDVF